MEARRQTVLIVDDMPVNIEIINEILRDNYDILFATNGEDALTIAAEQVPDLILLDVVMPGMNGYDICTKLKSDKSTRDIPVIFVTSMGQEEDESRGLSLGAIDYITKPIRPSIVKARVNNHMELKQYRDSLKTLSTQDGLTGIPNRRRFDDTLESEWRRARRNQTTISLLMMDIDYFKAYNDNYGHLAGDDCLRHIAGGLTTIVKRPADLVARYGGEEFVLLFPDTSLAGAVIMANHVLEKIELMDITHDFSEVSNRVTLSIGIASMIPADEQMPSDLIKRADAFLYKAKQNGRNQVQYTPG
jgi:diguanylate cyclase (GGDEF)-like protein